MKKNDVDLKLLATTAAASFAAALGVSGGTNVVMLLTGNDLIKKHRPTLTFMSAIIGDGVIIPFMNAVMIRSLARWNPRLAPRSRLVPVLGGSAITLAVHIAQGAGGMVNWTMTRPWKWNWLGYYHFIYMATQFSYWLLFGTELAKRWNTPEVTAEHKRDLAIVVGSFVAFVLLLRTDYEE